MPTKRGEKYLIPRAGDEVWVSPSNRDERIRLRTELELLRRCRMPAVDPRLAALEVRAGRSDDPDLADLQVIVCDAWSALVDSAIDEIDRRFPDIRQEIKMATIKDATAEIRNDALAAGDAGIKAASDTSESKDDQGQPSASNAVEETSAQPDSDTDTTVTDGESAEPTSTDQPSATSEPSPDDSTGNTPSSSEPEDSSPPIAEEANATTPDLNSDSENEDESTNLEELVESTAALVDQLAEQVEEITGQCEDDAEAAPRDDASADDAPTNDGASDETNAAATDDPVADLDRASQDSPTDAASGESGEAAAPTETVYTSAADGDASPDGASADQPAEAVIPPSEACDPSSPSIDNPQSTIDGSSVVSVVGGDENVSWTEADPSATNGFVGGADAVEVGVRNLIDFLSSEVLQKWQAVRSTFDAAIGLKAQVEESLTEARALCADLKTLQEQVASAATTAESAATEARLFRDEAREARGRADTQAREAEIAADRARTEAAEAERHALRAKSCIESRS